MATSQVILAIVAAVLSSTVLSSAVTAYFMRRRTHAEAGKFVADAHLSDAEASKTYVEQVQSVIGNLVEWMPKLQEAYSATEQCRREKLEAEIAKREAEAERDRSEKYAEGLRIQVVELQREVTDLNGRLRECVRDPK